jgi:hypothetical protein
MIARTMVMFYIDGGGREPGVVVRAMGMPSGKAVYPLDREGRLPISTNAVVPPIAPCQFIQIRDDSSSLCQ